MARKTDYSGIRLASVFGFMALNAQGDAVIYVIPGFGEICPRLDVMGFKLTAAPTAFLTGIVAPFQYGFMPLLVLVSADGGKPSAFLTFVSWVLFAALEMRRIAPFFGLRTTFDAVDHAGACLGRLPSLLSALTSLLRFLFGFVSALSRAELSVSTLGRPKLFTAVMAGSKDGRVLALPTAIDSSTYARLAWRSLKRLSAPGAMYSVSCLILFAAHDVTALARAGCLSAVLKSVGICRVLSATYRTGSSYQFAHVAS